MDEDSKALEVAGNNQMTMPQVMQLALEKEAGIETIGKMMELQERYEKNEARKAYHAAMTAFKENPPEINKDAHVNYTHSKGTTDYKHATLANVASKINKALCEHGLSAAWSTAQDEKGIAVTCKITHVLGHSEDTTLRAPSDTSGGKNNIQGIGSTVTYLQRYTILSLTGLATSESDDDGRGSETEYISEEQLVTINEYFDLPGFDKAYQEKFKKYMKVTEVDKILASDNNKAINALKAKEKEVTK